MAETNYQTTGQTLAKIDKGLELEQSLEAPKYWLEMSEIGHPCKRFLFYLFRNADKRVYDAKECRVIADDQAQKEIMARRLKMLPQIELHICTPDNRPIEFKLLLGHFGGYVDGMIKGIEEAPTTWHVWQHGCTETSHIQLKQLKEFKRQYGEKKALESWDIMYYYKAMIDMHCSQTTRHYMTVTTPGGRDYTSVRTEYRREVAEYVIDKAKSIIFDNYTLPPQIKTQADELVVCDNCYYKAICKDGAFPLVHCKTCRYRESADAGQHKCLLNNNIIDPNCLNMGCQNHVYNHALIQADVIEHQNDCTIYKNSHGVLFANCSTVGMPNFSEKDLRIFTSQELYSKMKTVDSILPEDKVATQVQKIFDGGFQTGVRWEKVSELMRNALEWEEEGK